MFAAFTGVFLTRKKSKAFSRSVLLPRRQCENTILNDKEGDCHVRDRAKRGAGETKKHNAPEIQNIYDETPTYHDKKWLMFEPVDTAFFEDFIWLLAIKRKPNRK